MTEKLIEEIISYRHKDLIEENVHLKNEIMQIKQLRTYYTEMYEYGIFHAVSEDELTKELMDANDMSTEIGKLYQEWVKEDETIEEQEFQNEFGGVIDERDATAFYAGYMACQKQNNWISVDDKLPEEETNGVNFIWYNIYCKDGVKCSSFFVDGKFVFLDHTFKDVTHWQPLPESPL